MQCESRLTSQQVLWFAPAVPAGLLIGFGFAIGAELCTALALERRVEVPAALAARRHVGTLVLRPTREAA